MNYIEEELARVRKMKPELGRFLDDIVKGLSWEIKQTIIDRWQRGESVDGGIIIALDGHAGYRNKSYAARKLYMNPLAGGSVDLTFSGKLGDGIIIKRIAYKGDYEITSTDQKAKDVFSNYDEAEMGLSVRETKYFMDLIKKSLIRKIQ